METTHNTQGNMDETKNTTIISTILKTPFLKMIKDKIYQVTEQVKNNIKKQKQKIPMKDYNKNKSPLSVKRSIQTMMHPTITLKDQVELRGIERLEMVLYGEKYPYVQYKQVLMKTNITENEEVTSYFHISMGVMFTMMTVKEGIEIFSKVVIAEMIKEFEHI